MLISRLIAWNTSISSQSAATARRTDISPRSLFPGATMIHFGFDPNHAKRPNSSGLGDPPRGRLR